MANKFLLVIAGPTAVGKTALSVQLAKHFSTEIISADSRQLYQEMSIGTAKPTKQEMQNIPHHLIDCVSIHQTYTAGDFEKDALKKLDVLFTKHNLIILCGGTGLYIDALCKGFDQGLDGDAKVKEQIIEQYNSRGLAWLQEEVKKLDKGYYNTADIHNPQRLMRALEVCLLTGTSYSFLRKNTIAKRNFIPIKIFINEDRETLYQKINKRVDIIIQQGLLKEAENLYPYKNLNALNTVGYKELFNFFDENTSLEKAIELIKQHTRNYAKRQITWFKNDAAYTSFLPDDLEKIKAFVEIVMQHS